MKYLWIVLLAGCHSVPAVTPPSEAQKAEIDRIFAARDATDAAGDRAFAEAAKKVATLAPGSSPCRVKLQDGDVSLFADRFAQLVPRLAQVKPGEDFWDQAGYVTFAQGSLDGLRSASRAVLRQEEDRLRDQDGPDYQGMSGDQLVARARKLASDPLPPELLIVLDQQQKARTAGHHTFVAGAAAAHAYLYDGGKFVCAGTVTTQSSKFVEVWYSRGQESNQAAYLNLDLFTNLLFAAEHSLRAL